MYRTRGANTVGQSDSIHAGMYMLPIFHVDVHEARSMENHPIRRELTAVFPLVYNRLSPRKTGHRQSTGYTKTHTPHPVCALGPAGSRQWNISPLNGRISCLG